jgi:uncharacterized protein (DUF302 family)
MKANLNNGLIHLSSSRSVAETMRRLESIVLDRGLQIVARVDHSEAAAEVGLTMPPAGLLIFGNPISGTPLMIASPTAAIDLPLKALVWSDAQGVVRVSYNSPQYLEERHRIPEAVISSIAGIVSICEEAVR